MDESIVKHLEQQTDARRLAAAIRSGLTKMNEAKAYFNRGSNSGCAVCLAAAGTGFQFPFPYQGARSLYSHLEQKGFDRRLLAKIDGLHNAGCIPALEIAARLERGELDA